MAACALFYLWWIKIFLKLDKVPNYSRPGHYLYLRCFFVNSMNMCDMLQKMRWKYRDALQCFKKCHRAPSKYFEILKSWRRSFRNVLTYLFRLLGLGTKGLLSLREFTSSIAARKWWANLPKRGFILNVFHGFFIIFNKQLLPRRPIRSLRP